MVGLSEDEVIYNPLPLYHTAGGMVGMGQVSVKKYFVYQDCHCHICTFVYVHI